jgi:hypothetical protein
MEQLKKAQAHKVERMQRVLHELQTADDSGA